MVSIINPVVAGNIETFLRRVDFALQELGKFNWNGIFGSDYYHLFSLVNNNVIMDLSYVRTLNFDYDIYSFPGIWRNIRPTIEAFYDLLNLVADVEYLNLLKYRSKIDFLNSTLTEADMPFTVSPRYSKYTRNEQGDLQGKYLSIYEKSEIAISNQVSPEDVAIWKEVWNECDYYIHPSLFKKMDTPEEKNNKIRKLLNLDCELLARSYALLSDACIRNFGYNPKFFFEPNREWLEISQANSNFNANYIVTVG